MLGTSTGRGSLHKCTTSKTITRHTEFSIVPCDSLEPNTITARFPAQKFQPLQVHRNHARVPEQGAATRHTTQHRMHVHRAHTGNRIAVPIRRSVHSSLKQQVPARVPQSPNHRVNTNSTVLHWIPICNGKESKRPHSMFHTRLITQSHERSDQ